jgi:cytochrome c-type biogenesis protein CcmH
MTAFWIIAAAMVLAVIVVLLRPLLRPPAPMRDDTAESNLRVLRAQLAELDAERAAGALDADQHAAARAEIERRVLEEGAAAAAPVGARGGRLSAAVLAVALPLVAFALYLQLGSQASLDPELAESDAGSHARAQEVEAAIQALADRLKAAPENPEGWALLARSYAQMGRFEPARDAFAEAVKRRGDDAQLLADYADAYGMAQGRRLAGEPEALIRRALAIDPRHLKSLALAGSAAMERRDYQGAVRYWTLAREVAPPDSPYAQGLAAGIAEARAAGGMAPDGAAAKAPAAADAPARASAGEAAPAAASATGAALNVTVRLDPALAPKVQAGDTLFVFARAAEGPRMPLAIARQPAGTGPVQVKLDDSMAMTPQMKLSTFPQVVVVARISRKGSATPEAGDLEGETAPRSGSGNVEIVIDRVRP